MFDLSNRLVTLRKKERKTQQDVAHYVGVSTAAVSKWETNQSYPDLSVLPKLATYFNCSIDDLLGYEPQMSKEHIQQLYMRLANDFQQKPFDEVYAEIQNIIKEYYACFPLLMQISVLLLNYTQLAGERTKEILSLAESLCIRIQQQSSDLRLLQLCRSLQAQIALIKNEPQQVIALFGEEVEAYAGNDLVLASAYLQLQQGDKAEETYQTSLFQKIVSNVFILSNYLQMQLQDEERFQETVERGFGLIRLFQLDTLHINSCISMYIGAAQGYTIQGRMDAAFEALQRYLHVIEQTPFPITLHGDDYFNKVDEWLLRELDLGQTMPRDEASLRQSLLDIVEKNPMFEPLKQDARYQVLVSNLTHMLGVNA